MGTLYVVATPIGNLQDIGARAVAVLRGVVLIAAEDTRHSRGLLTHLGITTRMVSCHAFNERSRVDMLLAALGTGDVALISDAGTPAISDPGNVLVDVALTAGFTVSCVPGPSSVTGALSVSGLAEGPFVSLGFLPRARNARRELLGRSAGTGFCVVVMEAPTRVAQTLREIAELFPGRRVAVTRELTKLHEETLRGTAAEMAAEWADREARGEFVIVIESGAAEAATGGEDAESLLRDLLSRGVKATDAAREAAARTGVPRSDLYQLALALKKEPGPDLR